MTTRRPSPEGSTRLAERRREERRHEGQSSLLWYQGLPVACYVINVSGSGAMVHAQCAAGVGAEIELQVPDWGRRRGQVRHASGYTLGLMFGAD